MSAINSDKQNPFVSDGQTLPIAFSSALAGISAYLDASVFKTTLSVLAPIFGYFFAWVVKEIESFYQTWRACQKLKSHRDDLIKQLNALPGNTNSLRHKEIQKSIHNCNQALEKIKLG